MALKSLGTALDVLSKFNKEKPEWGLRELAVEMEINHTVLHRILKTLQEKGYLIQNKSKKYELGLKIFDLFSVIQHRVKLSDLVYPVMKEISNETQETVFLTWIDGHDGVTVEISESDRNIKFVVSKGYKTPLYVGASTKVMMAFLDLKIQQEIINHGLKKFTKNTIVNSSEIITDLEQIRKQGWCYSEGEFSDDVFGIAVPLFDKNNTILASLTVCGPLYRIDSMRKNKILNILLEKQSIIEEYIQLIDTKVYR